MATRRASAGRDQLRLLDLPMPDPLASDFDAVPGTPGGVPPQLDLFARAPASSPSLRGKPLGPVSPTPVGQAERTLAAELPATVRFGTSSWSFPGWCGLVYEGRHTEERLARDGLAAYAAHPLHRTVSLDRGYYAPIPLSAHQEYAAVVPDDFRFVVKCIEEILVARFPQHPRYGARAGKVNEHFLDPEIAIRDVVSPAMQGLGSKLGPIVIQFPPQNILAMGGTRKTLDQLERFLAGLPKGPIYAVEFRNPELVSPALGEVLRSTGAVPCLSVHPTLPRIGVQARDVGALEFPALVCRWLLHAGLSYTSAVDRYEPFDQLVDEDPDTRNSIANAVFRFFEDNKAAYVVVNNKAEGSSPISVQKLAALVAGLTRNRQPAGGSASPG